MTPDQIPPSWRAIILDAISRRKMDVISGLHDFVGDDPEFSTAAKKSGVTIHDVRKNTEKTHKPAPKTVKRWNESAPSPPAPLPRVQGRGENVATEIV